MDTWLIWFIAILSIKAVAGICFLIYLHIKKKKQAEARERAQARMEGQPRDPRNYPAVASPYANAQEFVVPTVVVQRTPAAYPNGWQQPPPTYTQVTETTIHNQKY